MAEGGGFRQSNDIGSDVLYDFSCTPCAYRNKNKEAEMYCVECREYFCVSCNEDHNKFTTMRTHKMLDKAGMSTHDLQHTHMVLTEKCQIHHGNTIDTYCPVHQAIGCGTCIALQHRSCKGVAYIPKAAQDFKKSKEYKVIKPAIKSSLQQLKEFRTTIQTDIEDLHKERDVALEKIQEYRKSIEVELDRMERKITDDLHTKYNILQAEITANMKSIEDTMSKLRSSLKNLENIKTENEAELFVLVKNGNTKMVESDHLLQTLNAISQRGTLQFIQNRTIGECMNKCEKLGELQEDITNTSTQFPETETVGILIPNQDRLRSVLLTGEYNVKVKTDTKTCFITDCVFLNDKTILITDNSNDKLKRLNLLFQYSILCIQRTDYCDMPDHPSKLCVTGNKEVAVSLPKLRKVQFVAVGQKLIRSRSFTTTGQCSGLAYNNQTIFVSNFNSNDVNVYSENGHILTTIKVDISDLTCLNNHYTNIALSADYLKLVFSNGNNGIITVSLRDCQREWVCSEQMISALGLCVLDNDNILVADYTSNNVCQITGEGHIVVAVVQGKDGIEMPTSVCVDKANSRMIVAPGKSDKIKAFKFTT